MTGCSAADGRLPRRVTATPPSPLVNDPLAVTGRFVMPDYGAALAGGLRASTVPGPAA